MNPYDPLVAGIVLFIVIPGVSVFFSWVMMRSYDRDVREMQARIDSSVARPKLTKES